MGWMSQFLSKAVITGFLFGAAIEVVVGELPKLTGTEAEGANAWQKLWSWFASLSETDPTTVVVGVVSLVVIVGLRFAAPAIPGALVLVVGGLVASEILGLGDKGVALVGDVPRGLPNLAFPDLEFVWANIAAIMAASIGLLLIGFSQSAGDARAFASKHRYRVDINQESVAQGMCNVGSGLVQGIPVATSLSASSLNDSSGAKTPVASLTTGVMVILTLLILAPLLSGLPKAVLGALIIDAVVFGMMNVKEMRRLRHVARVDFWIAIAAVVGVVLAGVLAGVVIGVVLSLGWLIYVSAMPKMPVLGHERGTQVWHGVDDYPDSTTYPGLVVLRFDAGLFFASSDALEDRLRELRLQAEVDPHTVVIDCEGINFIDSQRSGTIAEIVEIAASRGIEIRLARLKTNVRLVLEREGVVEAIGEDHIYGNVYRAAADLIPD